MTNFFTPPELTGMGRGAAGYFDAINRQLAAFATQISALSGSVTPTTPTSTPSTVPPFYKSGLTTRRDSGTSITVLPGGAAPSSGAGAPITLGDARTKLLTPYAPGNASGGLTSGLAPNTWYHIYVSSGTLVDVFFDQSATAPNLPTGVTSFRRIGSFLTDGSSAIVPYLQSYNRFLWQTPVTDYSATTSGTVASRTLTVPDGVICGAYIYGGVRVVAGAAQAGLLTSLSVAAVTPSLTVYNTIAFTGNHGWEHMVVDTNTTRQIRSEMTANDANTQLVIVTLGWVDYFGEVS